MGRRKFQERSGALFHLILPSMRGDALVEDEEDWTALGLVAERMLFWCGGWIHACRAERRELHFAMRVAHASLGAMSRRISAGYARHLRRRRGWTGRVFKPYVAVPVDAALYLTDLVVWLHRAGERSADSTIARHRCWCGDDAYSGAGSCPWITTTPVLTELGRGTAGVQAYRMRKARGVDADTISLFSRERSRLRTARDGIPSATRADRLASATPLSDEEIIRKIAAQVAEQQGVSYSQMCAMSRRRDVARAKIVAAVLAVRHGVSVAVVARLFRLNRSTLIQEAEPYRERDPQLFEEAEQAISSSWEQPPLRGPQHE